MKVHHSEFPLHPLNTSTKTDYLEKSSKFQAQLAKTASIKISTELCSKAKKRSNSNSHESVFSQGNKPQKFSEEIPITIGFLRSS